MAVLRCVRGNAAMSTQAPLLLPPPAVLTELQQHLPQLLAVYAFGSRVQGQHRPDSDWDLAVLVAGYADPWVLFDVATNLAQITHCPVDLLDLRAASTVMQYQIITTGLRWWAKDAQAGIFEAMVLSEKTALNTARAGLLQDIARTGVIYDR